MAHDPVLLTAPPRASVSCLAFKRHRAGSYPDRATLHLRPPDPEGAPMTIRTGIALDDHGAAEQLLIVRRPR
jgi:hypothetical protein